MFALTLFLAASAAAPCLDPGRAVTQYAITNWKTAEGLPQNTVSALLQTRDGYLWVGTEEGLARFDGASFKLFDRRNSPGLPANHVVSLCEDKSGVLWIGTWGGGIATYKEGRFAPAAVQAGALPGGVWSIIEDHLGTIWAATSRGLLRVEGAKSSLLTTRDGLPSDNLRALAEDASGDLWIATRDAGLARYREGRFTSFTAKDGLSSNNLSALFCDRRGNLWIGTAGAGLNCLSGGLFRVFTTKNGLPHDTIWCINEDRRGNLWIGTYGGGLVRYANGEFSSLNSRNGLSDDFVWQVYEDREGNLWVGTAGGGLNRMKDGKLVVYSSREGLSSDTVRVVMEDAGKVLWIGTTGGGLCRVKDGRVDIFNRRNGLSSDSIRSLCAGSSGSIWVGSETGGLDRITASGRMEHYGASEGLRNAFVLCVLEDRRGRVWAGTNGGGLACLEGGHFTTYTTRDGLGADVVYALNEDPSGAIWAGTDAGLSLVRDGRFADFPDRERISRELITCIFRDREGAIWLGTGSSGLIRMKEGKASPITGRHGLFSETIFAVLEDSEGRFWMSCNKGIFSVPKRSLDAVADGRASAVECAVFARAEGLRDPECNLAQPAGWRASDGRLWFPTNGGAACVSPWDIRSNQVAPSVVIETALADGAAMDIHNPPPLPAGTKDLEFTYTGLSLASPEGVRFRYKLTGFDGGWKEAGSRRAAFYTNVPPGPHAFIVTACNEDGLWAETPATFAFSVNPHFYQRISFYLFCAAVALFGAWGLYRLRVQALRARERELVALVEERTRSLVEEKEKLELALVKIESQEKELAAFNRELSRKVREQLETILRSRRLARYFPKPLVEKVLGSEDDLEIASDRRLLTIFFADMRGFSTITDKVEPERTTKLLNQYLSAMAEVIQSHGGTLARFMGDGILGFFGAPDPMQPEEQAERCVRTALAMHRRLADLAREWKSGGLVEDEVLIRIGIHQDFVTVGNFGSDEHMEYTAIGRGINLAARLESACTPGKILASYQIVAATRGLFPFGPLEKREFKGFAHQIAVAELDPGSARETGQGNSS